MAAIEGAPAPAEERPDRRGGRRGASRSPDRGPGRWRRSAPLPEEFKDPSGFFPLDETGERAEAPMSSRPAPAPELLPAAPVNGTEIAPPVEVAPPADERAREASAEIAPREAPAPEPTPQPVVQREATEVVITQADPNRPKKGGWWQRVRTPFGG
jgi:ribonuclease E